MVLIEKIHERMERKRYILRHSYGCCGRLQQVHHKWLLHNLRKRKVPNFIVHWVESLLSNIYTQLCFNGVDSERKAIDAGVSQGSPISTILYLLYNMDQLEIRGNNGLSSGFIDDIAYGVQGESGELNIKELQRMLMKAEEWREKHSVKFKTSKYILMHFSRSRKVPTASITIGQTTIEPANEAKYLGVIFDRNLCFIQHIQYAVKKGTKFALTISRIAKST